MRVVDIIEKKKLGKNLSKAEIEFLINGYVSGEIPDYQISAFAMAVYFQGMSHKEIADLTSAMMNSGEIIDLSDIPGIKVDKHSTGGVGDKTSIAVGPIVASLGIPVAKMSGRGLGFTGGTLDKLESIPGYKIELSEEEFKKQVIKMNLAIIGQTKNIVPADKLLYALRDVTGTVDSLALIVSSIMSKKLATGSDAILLDVKKGDGAFMKTYEKAEELAKVMISVGKELNKDVRAEITSMDRPLGKAIGNKNEILEAVETLKGNGPKDFTEVVLSSSATIIQQAKKADSEKEAIKMVNEVIKNGKALEKFKEWIKAQNGDVEAVFKEDFWKPKYKYEVKATKNGYMQITSAVTFGIAAMQLGAGRATKKDIIDNEAGILINKKTNDEVKKDDVLFTLYSSKEIPDSVVEYTNDGYNINDKKVENKVILGKLV
ncbi:MAG: pyrimidine-nucleoside phosphorylase [Mycoplasmatales bacterium]|nr:pyrimidine-nucleoside phosphorylase [Mycoplasmatales bacterium]